MMNKEELCMNCMNPLPAGRDTCGICGHPVNAQNDAFCLPVGTMLSERYLVGVGVVEGGDRITYIGMDTVAKSPCQIHEFFPYTLCERDTDTTVRIIGGCENTYADYKAKFLSHARALARMRDVAILYPTYDIFEDNNTAYVITEVEEGQTWEAYLSAKGGRMRWDDVRPLLIPLLVGVRSLHAAGVLHMGISTKTVMVDNEGRLRLRGFMIPEARTVSGDLKPALAAGYAAPEQYNFDAPLTTATDVYGLTATLFRVLTGAPAPDAGNRAAAGNDLFVPASVAEELPDQVAVSLFNGLQVVADRRPRKVEQWQEALTASAAVNDLLVEDDDDGAAAAVIPDFDEEPREGKKSKRGVMIAVIALCVFLVLFLLAFGIIKMLFPEMFGGGDSTGTTTTTSTTASSTQPTTSTTYGDYNPQHVVPEVLNKNYYELIHETLNGNMVLKIDKMMISDKPAGTILEQNPAPSASADKGSTITVVISAGKETITVPDMTGWEEQYARLFLEQCGFKVGESIPLLVSTQEAGRVDKTDLEVGAEVKRNSVIRLYISTPPSTQPSTDPTDPSDTGDNTTSTDTETGVTEPSYSFVG